MTKRKTYTEGRHYSASVMKWRKAVYADRQGMTNGCRVLLLRLSDDMDARRVVSVPRARLAEDLGVAPARITEGIKLARKLGFLDIVRRARQHVTATYCGTFPSSEVRQGVPLNGHEIGNPEVRQYGPLGGTPERTSESNPEVRPAPTPRMGTDRTHRNGTHSLALEDVGSKERGCEWCGSAVCDRECLEERPQTKRRRTG